MVPASSGAAARAQGVGRPALNGSFRSVPTKARTRSKAAPCRGYRFGKHRPVHGGVRKFMDTPGGQTARNFRRSRTALAPVERRPFPRKGGKPQPGFFQHRKQPAVPAAGLLKSEAPPVSIRDTSRNRSPVRNRDYLAPTTCRTQMRAAQRADVG